MSVDWTFSTWVNDQLAGLTEHREKKMQRDRDELERTLNRVVVGLYLYVIFKWLFLWSSASPDSLDLLDLPACQGRGEEQDEYLLVLSQNVSGSLCLRVGTPEIEKVWKWVDKEQLSRLGDQCGKDRTKGIWKKSTESRVQREKKKRNEMFGCSSAKTGDSRWR